MILHQDITDAVGPRQLCGGHCAGIEAAVHSVRSLLLNKSSAGALLVDASNAFNSLNRATALHSIQYLCPPIANLVLNCYRSPSSLFVGGKTLISEEGTTQGHPLSMPVYALATIPLIDRVFLDEGTNQVWYADDSAAVGHLSSLRKWFDSLVSLGPSYCYYVNEEKTRLVVKPDYLDRARLVFNDTRVNITSDGRPYLGSPLGSVTYMEESVKSKV